MQRTTILNALSPAMPPPGDRVRQTEAAYDLVAKTAEKRFRASPYAALRSIRCEFHEGVLVLRGQVVSYYLKQLAQETARFLDGVEVIINAVEVR